MPSRNVEVLRASRKKYAKENYSSLKFEQVTHVDRSNAEFDPLRDGEPSYRDVIAQVMGEPPIGRSALDQRGGR